MNKIINRLNIVWILSVPVFFITNNFELMFVSGAVTGFLMGLVRAIQTKVIYMDGKGEDRTELFQFGRWRLVYIIQGFEKFRAERKREDVFIHSITIAGIVFCVIIKIIFRSGLIHIK